VGNQPIPVCFHVAIPALTPSLERTIAMATKSLTFSSSVVKALAPNFVTSRKGADRKSEPVLMMDARFDEATNTINVYCADGKMRTCRLDRLPSLEHGRALWASIQKAGKAKKPVQFVAAGGFTPDRWFYAIEA